MGNKMNVYKWYFITLFFFTAGGGDTINPVIRCPNAVVAYVAGGVTSTRVTWPPATATDNSGQQPSLTSNPALNSIFTLGFSTVMYTATDQSGNRATCTFPVNVIGECLLVDWVINGNINTSFFFFFSQQCKLLFPKYTGFVNIYWSFLNHWVKNAKFHNKNCCTTVLKKLTISCWMSSTHIYSPEILIIID